MGILFAFIALFSWGFGDFLIQKSTRKFGDWVVLFYLTLFASVILLPFIFSDLQDLFSNPWGLFILIIASLTLLLAALLDFEALKIGKICVVEPIYALEVPITAALATFLIGEYLSLWQIILILLLVGGILLVSTKSWEGFRRQRVEKGVLVAVLATICMGGVNFLFGYGARETSPLLINWFTNVFMLICCIGYLIITKRASEIVTDWKNNKRLIIGVSIVDNLAWVAYAYSMLYIPIAIATGISESYIALAAALGLIINREKLRQHQWLGLILALGCAIILAFTLE